MTTLLKHGVAADDRWTMLGDDDPLPAGRPVIVSPERWQADRDALLRTGAPLGVCLEPGQHPGTVARDLHHFNVVALSFPVFSDGRAYSYARILRDRLNFSGEIRAVGDVLRDQFLFMHRCGFDAFVVKKSADAAAFADALGVIDAAYQPAGDDRRLRSGAGISRAAARANVACPAAA